MKTIMLGFVCLGFAGTVLATDQSELASRIRRLTAKFEALQQQPDKAIPADTLRKAQGVILLDRTKAGFIFGYQGGGGVALIKDQKLQAWSPVAFLAASEASLGFQVGGEQDFYAILLMTTNAVRTLTEPKMDFGGEARGTAGDTTGGAQGGVSSIERPVMVYDDRKGFYGGAVIKAGSIAPDENANQVYYGEYLTVKDILFDHKATVTVAAADLAKKINWYSEKHATAGAAQN